VLRLARHETDFDSLIGIMTGYNLDGRGIGVRFSEGVRDISLLQRVHTGSGAHLGSYPMGIRSKVAEASS
jgi:hypothetical protein